MGENIEHKHHGKSSAKFFDSDDILKPLDFRMRKLVWMKMGKISLSYNI
jgi:hypothetical protein